MAKQNESELQKRMNMPRQRSAKLENFDEATRSVTLSFASETPCLDLWGDKEILRCNDEAMDTKRFADGVMPILYNHNRDIVVGKPTKIWTENGRAMATIEFATTDKAKEIMGLVRDGFLHGVSVGYRVMQWQVIEKGETTIDGIEGPAWIATRWEVFEISIVTVPADGTVGVGRALPFGAGDVEPPKAHEEREERHMENERKKVTPPAGQETSGPSEEEIRSAAIKAERERCTQIDTLCKKFGIEAEERQKWIEGGADIVTINRELLEVLDKRNKPVPNTRVEVGEDRSKEMRGVYADAILLRHGYAVEKPHDGADRLRYMSMRDIAVDMLERTGDANARYLDDGELLKRALTTGSLPLVLQDVTEFSIKQGYEAANTTYQQWAYIGSLKNFKPSNIVEIGAEAEPKEIPENGEFTEVSLSESKETVRLKPMAAHIPIRVRRSSMTTYSS